MLERTQQHEATQEANGALELAKDQARREQRREEPRGRVDFGEKGSIDGYDLDGWERLAKVYARSEMVPDQFKNNIPNCAIAIQMAQRCGVDILSYMQNCYVVKGTPGLQSKFAIGMLNSSGKISGTIQYDMTGKGDSCRCRAWAVDAASGQKVYGPEVTWAMVTAEGWNKPKGSQISKWVTIPELMFNYRSGAFFIKTRYPEVILGMQTVEELVDSEVTKAAMSEQPAAIQIPDVVTTNELDAPVKIDEEVRLAAAQKREAAFAFGTNRAVEVRKAKTPEVDDSKFMIKNKPARPTKKDGPGPKPVKRQGMLIPDDSSTVPEMEQGTKNDKWQSLASKLATCADHATVSAMAKALQDETCDNEEELGVFDEVVDARLMQLAN